MTKEIVYRMKLKAKSHTHIHTLYIQIKGLISSTKKRNSKYRTYINCKVENKADEIDKKLVLLM